MTIRKTITLCLIAASLFFIVRSIWFTYHKSSGFSLSKIRSDLEWNPAWQTDLKEEEKESIQQFLNQKFTYLSYGQQSYSYISEDRTVILKFFRMKRLTHSFLDLIFHPGKDKRHEKNLKLIFNAYKLADDFFKKESALLYVHLNKTPFVDKKVSLIDKQGKIHQIDLNQVPFVLQKRAEPISIRIKKLLSSGKEEEAKRALYSLLELAKRRLDKGIADEDTKISENYGFIGNEPVQFDVGRIYLGKQEGEYEEIFRKLQDWLNLNAPQLTLSPVK